MAEWTGSTKNPRYRGVTAQLTGESGNAYAVIGRVSLAIRTDAENHFKTREKAREAASAFEEEAFKSESYDALLQLCLRTVYCN